MDGGRLDQPELPLKVAGAAAAIQPDLTQRGGDSAGQVRRPLTWLASRRSRVMSRRPEGVESGDQARSFAATGLRSVTSGSKYDTLHAIGLAGNGVLKVPSALMNRRLLPEPVRS